MVETFDRVIAAVLGHPNGCFELRSPRDVLEKYTWSARIPGQGIYMGRVRECYGCYDDEESQDCLVLDHPETFIPEN